MEHVQAVIAAELVVVVVSCTLHSKTHNLPLPFSTLKNACTESTQKPWWQCSLAELCVSTGVLPLAHEVTNKLSHVLIIPTDNEDIFWQLDWENSW